MTLEQAIDERFLGSPTIHVNGRDIEPDAHSRVDFGMKCRLYRADDGGYSPVPPVEWIDASLRAPAA